MAPAPISESNRVGHRPSILGSVVAVLRAAGLDPDRLDVDDLVPLEEINGFGRPATRTLAELARVRPSEHILEVGSGLGTSAIYLAGRHRTHVTAVDVDPRVCGVADRLVAGTELTKQVDVICFDALALPFADSTFDLVWAQFVGHCIADKPRFLAELARVVRPDGRIALSEVALGSGGSRQQQPSSCLDQLEQSRLISATSFKRLLELAALDLRECRCGGAGATVARTGSVRAAPHVHLEAITPGFRQRLATLRGGLADRRIELVQLVASLLASSPQRIRRRQIVVIVSSPKRSRAVRRARRGSDRSRDGSQPSSRSPGRLLQMSGVQQCFPLQDGLPVDHIGQPPTLDTHRSATR